MSTKTTARTKPPASKPKSNPKPKEPLPIAERTKRLFASLCAQIDGGHYANAIKTCNKLLLIDPKHPDVLQTKLFLLLHTEAYDAALALIDASDLDHAFEKAYTLYRLQREDDARRILSDADVDEAKQRGVMHLEAQLHYREGSYQEAFDLYNQLLDTAEPNSEEHTDILTNLSASQAHLEFINTSFLRALDALPSSISAGLEDAPPPVPPTSFPQPSTSTSTSSKQPPVQAPKPPRPSRLPKSYIPGVTPPPDPERWLKKSERSSFAVPKGKRRGGGGGGGGASQGASVVDVPAVTPTPAVKAKGKKKK